MYKYIRNRIEKDAIADYPREVCGFIVANGRRHSYFKCENQAENDQDFKISAEDYARAEDMGQIIAVVHSHCDVSAKPTEQDRLSCEGSGLPWDIISVINDAGELVVNGWQSIKPCGYKPPLIGRQFHHGSLDCYSIIRDFYSYELGIDIPDFERGEKWWEEADADELYLNNFEAAGFFDVTDGTLQYGDVILMQYHSPKTNHGGIYLGDEQLKTVPDYRPQPGSMLHHPMPRLSERVIYGGYWAEITRKIVRHHQWNK